MKNLLVVIALVLVAGSGHAAEGTKAGGGGIVLDKGEKIWKAKCASCHEKPAMAKILKVEPALLDLKNLDPKRPRKEFEKSVVEGKGKMKGFRGKLKDDEIQAVLDYVQKTFLTK